MKIEHLAIWTKDLEEMKNFYLKYFDLVANEKYFNPTKQFTSYFLSFPTGARIELMHRPDITEIIDKTDLNFGFTHFAISLGSKEKVNQLTALMRTNGLEIIGAPRTTGDGYYESVVKDIEGNLIELTV